MHGWMESGAAGANRVKRVASMQIGASGTRLEVQSADSKSDRVWNCGGGWGVGGALKGTDEDEEEEEEDGGQDASCPTKLSGEPGIESLSVVPVKVGCREM